MGVLSKIFSRRPKEDKANTGVSQKDTGAGPAIAAHSKDAKATGAAAQNPKAAKTKRK